MPKFPYPVQRGSATVRIRPYDNHGSTHFLIIWSALGRRNRESRSTFESAKLRAEEVATAIANGKIGSLELSGADRDSYNLSVELLAPLKIPLHAAVQEFVEARRIAHNASLIEVAREYEQRHSDKIKPGKVPELVDLCLERKRADGLSHRYLAQLSSDLKRFARDVEMPVASVTTGVLEEWLRAMEVSPRTRDNTRTSLTTFFSFCRANGFLPRNLPTEAEALAKIKVPDKDVAIFTPAQMRKLLGKATPEMIPFITLGGFASLRPHEIQRLDWEAIRFSPKRERRIEVKASKAKTGSRRLAPLPDNLVAWLRPLAGTGPVLHKTEVWRDVTALASDLGIEWSQDVLRHSSISYRVALTGDVPRLRNC